MSSFNIDSVRANLPSKREFYVHLLRSMPPSKRLDLGCSPVMFSFVYMRPGSNMLAEPFMLDEVDDTETFPIAHWYISFWQKKLEGRLIELRATLRTSTSDRLTLFERDLPPLLNGMELSQVLKGPRAIN